MLIALITDIHGNKEALSWAFDQIKESEAKHIICLGDIASPDTIIKLTEAPLPVFCVFGNNDGDRVRMIRLADAPGSKLVLADREWADITLDDKTFFCTHYPELAEHAATSGKYDAVFFGHTHEVYNDMIGDVPILNPGKLALYPLKTPPSMMFYNTQSKEVTLIHKELS